MNWWATQALEHGGVGYLVSWCFWVIASVVLHELAHGIAAIRVGDRTPIDTGHMTWNPAVHMGASGVVMFALLGVTWGSMPVDPSRFRGRHADAMVSFAGPLTNIWLGVLAVVGAAVMVVLHQRGIVQLVDGGWADNLAEFFYLGARLNIVLVMLNLLPIPPLDGSRILASFSRQFRGMIENPQAASASLVFLAMIFFFGGRHLYPAAANAAAWMIAAVARVAS
jgi:Zn-dependent protease